MPRRDAKPMNVGRNFYLVMKRIIFGLFVSLPCFGIAQQKVLSIVKNSIEKNSGFYKSFNLEQYSEISKPPKNELVEKPNVDSLIFNATKNTYIGPVQNESSKSIYLINDVNAKYKMRVAQIYLDPTLSEKEIDSIANIILTGLKNAGSFVSFCKKYSYHNRDFDCDLGWFKSGDMVKEFEEEVLKHKKGDIFRVKTVFGTHIVNVLENSIEESRTVIYTEIKFN